MNKADFDYCKDEFLWFLNVQYGDLKGKINEQIDEFCHNFCFDDLYNYEAINKLFLNVEDKKRYIDKATEIIRNRARKISNILKSLYN